MRYIFFQLIALLAFANTGLCQEKWDVNDAPGEYKEVNFTVNEGTWMNVDISPDGFTIVFDLLGDIYSIPFIGGQATLLRSGPAWEVQPRFSSDGNKILFTSDAGGGDNIWVMNADGSDARQITEEKFRLLNNPAWMPDGEYFIARKHFTSERSLGAGEMWMYHITGGEGVQITKRKNDQQDVNEPCISPDGKYLYYSEDVYPGGYFQYNKDPNSQIYVTKRYNFEDGKTETVVGGPGGAVRPQINHSGDKLAYIRRVRTKSVLYIRELDTGLDYPIYHNLSKDQQEAWAIFGVYPGFAWTPDDKYIIIWSEGKIKKVDIVNRNASIVPFEAHPKHRMAETVRFDQNVYKDRFQVKVIRQLTTSPDGEQLMFNALGKLHTADRNGKNVVRVTDDPPLEFSPQYSPDGNRIVYVTWDDQERGAIMYRDMRTGVTEQLTSDPGIYRNPVFSADGEMIAYRKDAGNTHQGYSFGVDPGIYVMKIDTRKEWLVTPSGDYPQFTADNKHLLYQSGGYLFGSLTKELHKIDLDGKKSEELCETKYGNRLVPSPDGKWLAFSELHKVYVTPMPKTGQKISITSNSKSIPVQLVSKDAGINIHWSADSKRLHWTLGPEYFTVDMEERFPFLGKVDSVPPADSTGILIDFVTSADKPSGVIALTHARILPMTDSADIIEDGTIIVRDNKIIEIGPHKNVDIPQGAYVLNCTGKVIMPGLVDVHAHLGAFRFGLSPQKHWQYWANLAFGVTTTHDPSSNTEMTFAQSEMVKSGVMVGPRIFSTGTILYGADGDFKAVINSLDDARSALKRTKAFGAFSVKSYNQPRRDQRQQVMQAAREMGINVYPEGGSFFYHNMTMVADGHTGVEHNIPVAPLYDDVIKFWSSTKSGNTPTLIVNYGGVNGEYFYYQRDDVWADERLNSFTPRPVLDSRSRHRMKIPHEEYENGHILVSQSCNRLQQAGVNINMGSHGQLQGLGAHWEIWMLVQGGMSNYNALKAATINGAQYLGMDSEIGTLEVGKLADIIVLDADPLENIENSRMISHTMINGRLYESATMNEIGHREVTRVPFYWEEDGSSMGYPFFMETMSHMQPQCSCRQ